MNVLWKLLTTSGPADPFETGKYNLATVLWLLVVEIKEASFPDSFTINYHQGTKCIGEMIEYNTGMWKSVAARPWQRQICEKL